MAFGLTADLRHHPFWRINPAVRFTEVHNPFEDLDPRKGKA